MLIDSNNTFIYRLSQAIKATPSLLGTTALILNAACSGLPKTLSDYAGPQSKIDSSIILASSISPLSAGDNNCATGLVVLEQDLNSGNTFPVSYVDSDRCLVNLTINDKKFSLKTYFGFMPAENFSNFEEVQAGFNEIILNGKETAIYDQKWSNLGAPSISHMTLTRINNDPYLINGLSYPSIYLNAHNTDARGSSDMKLRFSFLPDGKPFLSEKVYSGLNQHSLNVRVLGIVSYNGPN